jgi:hypothetical protein
MSKDIELCSTLLMNWGINEYAKKDMTIYDEELEKAFIFCIIRKKFNSYGIKIVLPDELLAILTVCTNSNPGQSQILLKYLLNDIKQRKGPIPEGYVITVEDFAFAFQTRFPILHEYKDLYKKFEKLWDEQKKVNLSGHGDYNMCDTPGWWLEVMEE